MADRLSLEHFKGFSSSFRGFTNVLPSSPSHVVHVLGSTCVLTEMGKPSGQRVMLGHDDDITAFAVSPRGSYIATGQRGKNADVVLWNGSTLTETSRFQEHDHEVMQLAFSHDERLVMTVGSERDKKLFVLDTSTGKIVAKTAIDAHRACASAWSPVMSGKTYTFAYAANDIIVLWTLDPFTGQIAGSPVVMGSVKKVYTSMMFSSDGQWLFGGTTSGEVVSINVARKAAQVVHPATSGAISAMLRHPSGKVLLGAGDGSLVLFNVHDMRQNPSALGRVPGAIMSMSETADGGYVVSTNDGGMYRVNGSSGAFVPIMHAHVGAVRDVVVCKHNGTVASVSSDGSVCVWNPQDFTMLARTTERDCGGALCLTTTHTGHIITGWQDGHVRCYTHTPGAPTLTNAWLLPNAHTQSSGCGVTAMKVAHKGHFLVTGGANGEVRVWDMSCREMVSSVKQTGGPVNDVQVLKDDAHIAVASENRCWSLWDFNAEKCKATYRTMGPCTGLWLADNQMSVTTVSKDRKIQSWDVRQAEAVRTQDLAHDGEIWCIAGHESGSMFATAGTDRVVKVWDAASGRLLAQTPMVHSRPVTKMVFIPGTNRLVSVAEDGGMCCWNFA